MVNLNVELSPLSLRCSGTNSTKKSLSDHHKRQSGAQRGSRAQSTVLGFFFFAEAMLMHMIFQGWGAYQEKVGPEGRTLCARWFRRGGGVQVAIQLEDVTLTCEEVERGLSWDSENGERLRARPWWEHRPLQAGLVHSLALSGSSDWLAPSSIMSLESI